MNLNDLAAREAARRGLDKPPPAAAPAARPHNGHLTLVENNNPRARRWLEVTLQGKVDELAGMGHRSGRNAALNATAYFFGRFSPKWLDEQSVKAALLDACHSNGLVAEDGMRACEDSFTSGFSNGQDDPRDPPIDSSDPSGLKGMVAGEVAQRPPRPAPLPHEAAQPRQEPADSGEAVEPENTWQPVDLGPYLDGTFVAPVPTLLGRQDGQALMYPARVHWLSGEPEAMKSWVALLAVAQVLLDGGRACYLDFEDGPAGITGRLVGMGVPAEVLNGDRFEYLSPHEPLTYGRRDLLEPLMASTDLLVIDACTESLAMQQLSPKDDVDVASWQALLPRWAVRHGAAVLVLDHVVKDSETRGRWATGSQHKLAGLDGVAFMLEAVEPGGVGMRGRSRLYVSKDRHGQVRPHTVRTVGPRDWAGDLLVDSTGPLIDVVVTPPAVEPGDFRPTVLMQRVSDCLAAGGRPMTKNDITERVKGKAVEVRRALAFLVDDGFVTVENGPKNSLLHTLTVTYPRVDEES